MKDKEVISRIEEAESIIACANEVIKKIGFPFDYIHVDAETFAVLMKNKEYKANVKTASRNDLLCNYHVRLKFKSIVLMACAETPEGLGLEEADFVEGGTDVNT